MTKCTACLKELGKKEVMFTEDKQPYCINPFTCNDLHPNSVQNIVARGGAVKMFTEEELETSIFDRFNISDELKERIMKVANKPQSIRLSKYEIAYYLLQLQAYKELSSISEAVRYCVNLAMKQEPIEVPLESLPSEESSDNTPPRVVEASQTGIKFVVPDMPKSINVNWNEVNVPKKDPVPADEDEFTF